MDIVEEEIKDKKKIIIEAAIKRFSHFGISKTSLTEIGQDAGISKQLFSYYFNDKNSLVYSVVEKISYEFILELKKVYTNDNVSKALIEMLKLRNEFMKKYYLMVVVDGRFDFPNLGVGLIKLRKKNETIHFEMLEELLGKGIRSNQFKNIEPAKTAEALIQTFHAFDFCLKERTPIPTDKDFDDNLKLQLNALSIFLQGLNN